MIAIEKIRLINFQSHEDTEILFDRGFNVIVGGSDQGKTAIIRALRWLLYNEPRGTDFMRIGTNTCKVIVTLTDGTQISRERSASRNVYILKKSNGEEQRFEGFGSSVPEEITKAHGMGKIFLDTDIETSLNIGYQLDGPFLLSETGTTRAKAIGRLVGIHLIDSAIRSVIKDLFQLNQEHKLLDNTIKDLNEQLLLYADLDDEKKAIEETNQLLINLENKIKRLDKLKARSAELKTIITEIEKQQNIIDRFSNISNLETMLDKTIYYSQFLKVLRSLREREKIITGHLKRINKIMANTVNIFEAEKLLSFLNNNYLPQSNRLKDLRIKIGHLRVKIKKHRLWIKELNKVIDAEQLYTHLANNYQRKVKLSELKLKLDRVTEGMIKGKKYLVDNENKIKVLLENYNARLLEIGRCPLCYSKISKDVSKRIIDEYKKEENL
ncbi:MAG TPA: AAA family ATPase [Clostridia bacterium]|nr:AAA family ATPase [Clostridia bacterium]